MKEKQTSVLEVWGLYFYGCAVHTCETQTFLLTKTVWSWEKRKQFLTAKKAEVKELQLVDLLLAWLETGIQHPPSQQFIANNKRKVLW